MKVSVGRDKFDIQPLYPGTVIKESAIYTIWTFDPSGDEYIMLYAGECGGEGKELSSFFIESEGLADFQISGLYVAVNYMPEDEYSNEDRENIHQILVDLHRPLANVVD